MVYRGGSLLPTASADVRSLLMTSSHSEDHAATREQKQAELTREVEALERAEVARITELSSGNPAEADADRERLSLHARVADLLDQLAVSGSEASQQRKLNAVLRGECDILESTTARDMQSKATASNKNNMHACLSIHLNLLRTIDSASSLLPPPPLPLSLALAFSFSRHISLSRHIFFFRDGAPPLF